MGEGGIFDYESGGEDRGGQFSAVVAVADEDLGYVFALDWLCLVDRWLVSFFLSFFFLSSLFLTFSIKEVVVADD